MVGQMHASSEHTVSAIADTFSVTRPTIYRVLDSDTEDLALSRRRA
jgi:helix-turn-helix resolvase-like protein